MYDWITASYDISDIPHQRLVSKIYQLSEVKNMLTGTIWSNGYLINHNTGRKMGMNICEKRIKIEICPNKFILGNNVEEAPINTVFNTLYDLSHTLELNLGDFKLEKLDVTHTALTDFIPEMYYPYLCNNMGFTRWYHNTSLYYDANSYKIKKVFYDKVKEVDDKWKKRKSWGGKQKIPDNLKGQNLTRFECRLGSNSEIKKVIGHQAVLGQLFTPEHIDQLQSWWLNQYEAIPKTTELNWKFEENMGQKAVDETIYHLALMELGKLKCEELIELADRQGAYNHPSQKTRSKRKLLGAFNRNGKKHNLINELDDKYRSVEPKWD